MKQSAITEVKAQIDVYRSAQHDAAKAMDMLVALLAKEEVKEAKKAAKKGGMPALPASPASSETDEPPREPKKPKISEWGLFIKRVGLVLEENKMAGDGLLQFASYLNHKKPMAEWVDSEIIAEKMGWVKPEKAEKPKKDGPKSETEAMTGGTTGDEAKPKKRGRNKALKEYAAVIASEAVIAAETAE